MFEFAGIKSTQQHQKLHASCKLDAELAFFKGHFESQPLMPAAAQLQMVDALIQSHKAWRYRILGGRRVKFVQKISPDETIDLHLIRPNSTSIEFILLKADMSIATKGILTVTRGAID